MFTTIFNFEIRRWFKNWEFYVYLALFFLMGLFIMGANVGFFDGASSTTSGVTYLNSPTQLAGLFSSLNTFLYFLIPSIVGMSIYRDYKYQMQSILYSYPLTKWQYLLGKFLAGICILIIITLALGVGIYLATILPWAKENLLGVNYLWSYLQIYLLIVIPNLLFVGAFVLSLVTLSRSIYVGFVGVLILLIIQGLVGTLASDVEYRELAALIDPTGMQGMRYYSSHWSVDQVNTLDLPLEKWFVFNRLFWLAITVVFICILARLFNFSQTGVTLNIGRTVKGKSIVKDNFPGVFSINLPKVSYDYSTKEYFKKIFYLTKVDFSFLAKNKVFMILVGIGILLMILTSNFSMMIYGTPTYPITRQMIEIPSSIFTLLICIITFLSAGLLTSRGSLSGMNLLVDSTPVPNWVFFWSKFLALIALQVVLQIVVLLANLGIQISQGYYVFELGLYFQHFFGIVLIYYIIWAGIALFVQTLFKNYIIGFFVLLVIFMGWSAIESIGLEQRIFYINDLPTPTYSDMNGYGTGLPLYYTYALYWMLFVGFLSSLCILFYKRGARRSIKDRFYYAKKQANGALLSFMVLCLLGFLSLGGYLYYENTILNTYYSAKDRELMSVEYENKYKKYSNLVQPRIVDVDMQVDLFPSDNDFVAKGRYTLLNKDSQSIDSLLVSFITTLDNTIDLQGAKRVWTDSVHGFSMYYLQEPLKSGDSLSFEFVTKNMANTFLRKTDLVLDNGTFMNNGLFPSFGYKSNKELSDDKVRQKYDLAPKDLMALQTDSLARKNTYISQDADWIDFQAVVSTSLDQIAIAPGYLQNQWEQDGRNYFHYKMDQKMLNFYAFNSGRYSVKKDSWNGVNLEIYYHLEHPYNLDRMMASTKASLEYFSQEFGPYQHKQVRIVEFPINHGTFAQSFANTIPFSEGIGFVAAVDESKPNAVDYPYSVTSHEVAHQWWAHQVIGANVQGATMLSESLSEYSALKVLEKRYGASQMQRFLKDALNGYLSGRRNERKKEQPLMYNENQQYLHYNKGSLVFYSLSDYLGEDVLNSVLKDYVKQVAFQDAPFTVSTELVDKIQGVTPDSLQYLIKDMFHSITLYDNYIDKATVTQLEDGTYKVDLSYVISKFRSGDKGKKLFSDNSLDSLSYRGENGKEIYSLPLQDYVEIGIFTNSADELTEQVKPVYLQKHKVEEIYNELSIIVKDKPSSVGVDPYFKLIDARAFDNNKNI